MDELMLNLTCDAVPEGAEAICLRGREAISEVYRLELGLRTTSGFDAEAALRAAITLEIETDDEPYPIRGMIAEVELVHQWEGNHYYRITIVPRLWMLSLTLHSRIYTDNTILEIIEAVLQDGGLSGDDYSIHTTASYEPMEHVCQYKESNLDFISRWMEKEGLYYFFDHDGASEKLIITDDKDLHQGRTVGGVGYRPHETNAPGVFNVLSAKHSALPATMRMTDYNYLTPSVSLSGQNPITPSGSGDITLFGDNAQSSAVIDRYTQVRSQEIAARQQVVRGSGRLFRMRPNYQFKLEEHPNASYVDKDYLVVSVEHVAIDAPPEVAAIFGLPATGPNGYRVDVTAIPTALQYRAPRLHAWPRVDGYEHAVVCGPDASDYAQIDDHGRYRCRVHFDESDLVDGSATTWVRMMQPHAGGVEGMHFPLRKGTEVVLFFLSGDPDRPMIAGAVPNPETPSPVTQANSTTNVIQTGARNRIELEDNAGQEQIHISTPYSNTEISLGFPRYGHEVVIKTDHNTLFDFGVNYDLRVGNDWDADVTNNVTLDVESGFYEITVHTGHLKQDIKTDIDIISHDGDITIDARSFNVDIHAQTDITNVAHVSFDTKAETGYVKIDAVAGPTDLLGENDVSVKSRSGNVVIDSESATVDVDAAVDIDLHAGNMVNITSDGETNQTSNGPWYNYSVGEYVKFKNSSGITFGLSETVNISAGIKLSASLSAEASATASLKASIAYAVAISSTYGASLSIKNGISISAVAGLAKLDTLGAKLCFTPAIINNAVARLESGGAHVIT